MMTAVTNRLTPEEIKGFWAEQARTHGTSPAASWSDVGVIDLEVREIVSRLNDGDRVLDIGCGNGYSTLQWASQKRINVRAIDYVPELIEHARRRLAASPVPLPGSAEFDVGDIMELNEPANSYDRVITVRVLINLGGWDAQRAALHACVRVTKPGGLLLLSEATAQGWTNLNAFRAEWGLEPIPMPSFNTYLDEAQVVEELSTSSELVELVNFASTYFVGTRVLKPLLSEAAGDRVAVAVANPNMHWNRWWASLPAWGDYGTQKLFIFRKRA
jgi:ubiquinone/menaquinone biosynthesis C-methylase UbiE